MHKLHHFEELQQRRQRAEGLAHKGRVSAPTVPSNTSRFFSCAAQQRIGTQSAKHLQLLHTYPAPFLAHNVQNANQAVPFTTRHWHLGRYTPC